MAKLILLGGPPGVGKSTVIQEPPLEQVVCLDADQIWDPLNPGDRSEAIETICSVVSEKMAIAETVLLAWVFAKPELFQPFIEKFSSFYQIQQVYLVCEPGTLAERLHKRDTPNQIDYALKKLNLIQRLPFDKIDSTNMASTRIAEAIKSYI